MPMYEGVAIDEPAKGLQDYLALMRRRKSVLLTVASVLFAIAVAVALLWPPSYRSIATILIEEQEIPPELVRSTVTSFADQRIQELSQRVMTRSNLSQVMDKFHLYADQRDYKTTEEILDRMRKDIKLDMISADVLDPRTGLKTTATIAFTLSYDAPAPATAQQVTNELVSLYLNENLKTRQQKSEETSTFLAEEVQRLEKHIAEVDQRMAHFKGEHVDSLPEMNQLNLQLRDRTDLELQQADRDISAMEQRRFEVQAQLAQIKPNSPMFSAGGERILDTDERLKSLEAQYASLSGIYSAKHPELIRMKSEIDALKKATGGGGADAVEDAKRLAGLKAELATMREKYSDRHPDVIRLKASIASLEKAQRRAPVAPAASKRPENPAYITLQAQVEDAVAQLKTLRKKHEELEAKIADYDHRLEQTPRVERDYLEMLRDREYSDLRYKELKQKLMEAQVAQELEKGRKGERFTLIDPPQLPERPHSPNRPVILILGLLLSLGGGVAYAGMLDAMDHSVWSMKTLAGLLPVPVLSVIPYIETRSERARKRKGRRVVLLALVIACIGMLAMVHFLWIPLDVLWYRALRKLEL